MKKTLLQIVQDILSDMDSEEVNSISDSVEAQQVAAIVESTFNNLIATRVIPEHKELLKLTAASDSAYPTHFSLANNVKEIEKLWYKDSDGDYTEIKWVEPIEFLKKTDGITEDYTSVSDKNGGTTLRIRNDTHPTFYTSFDDYWIVLNAHKSTVDATLSASKIRAYGTVYPTFSQTDGYTPDLDGTMFPLLINESKSVAMSLLKGASDPKIEQAARRQKSYIQNDMYRVKKENKWNTFGR